MAQTSHNERRMRRVKNENRFLRLELKKLINEVFQARTVAAALELELQKYEPKPITRGVNSVSARLAEAPNG